MQPHLFSDYTRRDFVKFGLAGALGVSFSGWLPRLARAVEDKKQHKACILLWMNGGPSQTDTFDPKPGHKNGGPFKAIETAVPGIRISEHLPGLAKQMKDMVLLRGMTSSEGDHARATQLMLTGYKPQQATRFPGLGSLVAKELGRLDNDLPNYVAISPFQFAEVGAGFLGPQYAPLSVSGDSDDPQARANLSIENLSPSGKVEKDSMERRFGLLDFLQNDFSAQFATDSSAAHKANYDRAVRMVRTQAKNAFKLEEEPAALRDAYGRNRFGQGCLLARRLVERGVPFVEVTLARIPGNDFAWDTHANNFDMVEALSDVLDPGWSTLMNDLRDRGLLDSTLIVWMGEFGRTPEINQTNGRDHFPLAWSTVLAGGGIKGGQVVGDTGADGMQVVNRPIKVPELFATICTTLGIDPSGDNISPEGRPISIVEDKMAPIAEIVGTKQS